MEEDREPRDDLEKYYKEYNAEASKRLPAALLSTLKVLDTVFKEKSEISICVPGCGIFPSAIPLLKFLRKKYPSITKVTLYLIDPLKEVLPIISKKIRAYARESHLQMQIETINTDLHTALLHMCQSNFKVDMLKHRSILLIDITEYVRRLPKVD